MATTSSVMQSVHASPVRGLKTRGVNCQFFVSKRVVAFGNARVGVRCMVEENEIQKEEAVASSIPTNPPLSRKPKVSTKFRDLLAFSGPAPERINGRLAMIGFTTAMAVEASRGGGLFAQISEGSGVQWFVATSVVFTLASLVPLFKGVTVESRSEGLMNSDAEMWNGRFAMLGLVALAVTEYLKDGSFIGNIHS